MYGISWKRELIVFFGYFIGYGLLIAPILVLIFNGRAFMAEARYYASHPREISFKFGLERYKTASVEPGRADSDTNAKANYDEPHGNTPSFSLLEVQTKEEYTQAEIIIPKLGVAAPIVFSQGTGNREIQKDLELGVIHYPESARFGEPGISILLGHSSAYPWYKGNYGSVFSLINKLKPGDEFTVLYKGRGHVYRVSDTKVVIPKDFRVENPDGRSHLILMSCWPIGTSLKRIVVFSDLVSIN